MYGSAAMSQEPRLTTAELVAILRVAIEGGTAYDSRTAIAERATAISIRR
jgi:hypothetical protein